MEVADLCNCRENSFTNSMANRIHKQKVAIVLYMGLKQQNPFDVKLASLQSPWYRIQEQGSLSLECLNNPTNHPLYRWNNPTITPSPSVYTVLSLFFFLADCGSLSADDTIRFFIQQEHEYILRNKLDLFWD